MTEEIESLKIDIVLVDVAGEEKKFTTLKSLSKFIDQEAVFWREAFGALSNQNLMIQLLGTINSAKQELNTYQTNFPKWDEITRQNQLNAHLNRVKTHMKLVAFSMTPLAIAFADVCKLGYQQAHSFWVTVTGFNSGQLQDHKAPTIEGAILGYEFSHQDESIIYKRRDSEKRSLASLRKTLSDKTDEIVSEVDDFQKSINDWRETAEKELQEERTAYKDEQEAFLASAEELLNDRMIINKNDFETFLTMGGNKVKELEELYREKLRLEPAANYWATRANKLKWAGRFYGAVLGLGTATIGVGFAWLFHAWMTKGEVIKELSAEHWQGVVILAATITMAIYAIRVLGKITFSAFHLQRDAEEREQLTYLYLALSKDGNVDVESRRVVLQSLFSRAETGLLTGDHGPTIPVSEIVQKFKSN